MKSAYNTASVGGGKAGVVKATRGIDRASLEESLRIAAKRRCPFGDRNYCRAASLRASSRRHLRIAPRALSYGTLRCGVAICDSAKRDMAGISTRRRDARRIMRVYIAQASASPSN